jgi:hypothetical protein
MHKATLLSGDLDFKPLIDALVQEGMFVTLWYPPRETAKELIAAADSSVPLHIGDLHRSWVGTVPFVMPRISNEGSRGDFAPIIKTWSIDGVEAKLYKAADSYVVALPDRIYPARVTYYEHLDFELLTGFLADAHGIIVPQ